MIFIIATDNRSTEERVVAHLAARSIQPISMAGTDAASTFTAPEPSRHYVLHGIKDISAVTGMLQPGTYRTAAIGAVDCPAPDIRFNGSEPDLIPRLEAFVAAAMSAFLRPSWDEYFMDIAKVVGRRSNCMKRQVAAVVVKDRRIVSTGYNGTPRGAKNCNEGGCPRCNGLATAGSALDECLCNHAEENAVAQAAYHGIAIRGATIYCTYSPCLRCTKLIINAGIEEVVYNARYDLDETAMSLLRECEVRVRGIQEG